MKKNLAHANTHFRYQLCTALLLLFPFFAIAEKTDAQEDFVAEQVKAAEKAIRMQEFTRAYGLFDSAAKKGNAEAQYQVANLLTLGTGTQENKDAARIWLAKSAAQDHPAALYQLAMELKEKDPNKADQLIQQSGELNYAPALHYLKQHTGVKVVSAFGGDDEGSTLWFGAARKNSPSELEQLKTAGQHINGQDSAGRTALFTAIESNSQAAIDWLLTNKADPNHADAFGNTPLFVATRIGDEITLKKLIQAGANIQTQLPSGDNLWHYSIRLEQTHLAALFLQKKITLNVENNDGWTPLDIAEYKELEQLTTQIKKHGGIHGKAWSNQKNIATHVTPDKFFKANGNKLVTINETAKIVLSGNTALIQEILKNQPQLVNQQLPDGSTLLVIATNENNLSMVDTLITSEANINQPTAGGITALHIAARVDATEIIDRLIQAQANPLQKDHDDLDAIDWAIQLKQETAALHLLASLGYKKDLPYNRYLLHAAKNNLTSLSIKIATHSSALFHDKQDRTALWYGAYHSNTEIIKVTQRLNNNDKIDTHGKSPFHIAIEQDCFDCATLLVSPENINQTTLSGDTPLMTAATNANPIITEWLITQNADIDARTIAGNTALIYATENHALDVVKLLVNAKAKIGRKNKLGFSALDIAETKDTEIFTFLKEKSVFGLF